MLILRNEIKGISRIDPLKLRNGIYHLFHLRFSCIILQKNLGYSRHLKVSLNSDINASV
jgi:hypothetical protein